MAIFIQIVAGLLFTYATCCGLVWLGMRRPPHRFVRAARWMPMPLLYALLPLERLWKHARRGRLRPGDPAPDFELPTLNGASTVRLSSFRGTRPVMLVFGSYT